MQVPMQKYKYLPFRSEVWQERLTNATGMELEEMHAALLQKEAAIQHHLDLIQQLEDDTVCKNPYSLLVAFK